MAQAPLLLASVKKKEQNEKQAFLSLRILVLLLHSLLSENTTQSRASKQVEF